MILAKKDMFQNQTLFKMMNYQKIVFFYNIEISDSFQLAHNDFSSRNLVEN